jgi:hypothetical protein
MPMPAKETAINFLCYLLLPPDEMTERICKEALKAQRIKITSEVGKRMLKELKPPKLDIDQLGTQYHSNYEDEVIEAESKEFEGDNRLSQFSKLNAKSNFDITDKKLEQERLQDFELEKDTGQHALKDVPYPKLPDPYDIPEDPELTLYPINYYDNDDGFWDEWIEKKNKHYDEVPMIAKRLFFKH